MNCEVCGKETDTLYSKTKYNQNQETRDMCLDCYEEIHEEEFYETAS